MTSELKLASNVVPFSKLVDRFVPGGYADGRGFEEQMKALSGIEGLRGVGFGWPCHCATGRELRQAINRFGLELAALEPDIYTERRFARGSLSHPDAGIRRQALDRVRETMDAAEDAGVDNINLWLGHDGFEYFFQGHYTDAWSCIVEGLAAAAEHNPNVTICLEGKCKEPRAKQYVANTSAALLLANRIGRANMGITLDFGHSLAALENPAQMAAVAMAEGRLRQVHINDNYRDWDLDLVPGAVSVWDHVEFFYWLRKLGYDGWLHTDIFPYREPGPAVVEVTVKVIRKCCALADRLIEMNLEQDIRDGRYVEIVARLWDLVG